MSPQLKSLVLMRLFIPFVEEDPNKLEQLREVCCCVLRGCGAPLFLTSIVAMWVHITMAQLALTSDEGCLDKGLPDTEIDVSGAAPCKQVRYLRAIQSLPNAVKLRSELPAAPARVSKILHSTHFISMGESEQQEAEKYLVDAMFVLQMCVTVLDLPETSW